MHTHNSSAIYYTELHVTPRKIHLPIYFGRTEEPKENKTKEHNSREGKKKGATGGTIEQQMTYHSLKSLTESSATERTHKNQMTESSQSVGHENGQLFFRENYCFKWCSNKDAISIAVRAASDPLFPALPPARFKA